MSAPACVFLPGLVMPAEIRYARLFGALGSGGPTPIARDLAVAEGARTIDAEVDAIEALRRERGFDRLHLYGHSAGGAVALAYVAAHPDRVGSLSLDEPSTDFSAEDLEWPGWSEMARIRELPFRDGMVMFRGLQVGQSVSAALPGETPPWMSVGPERIEMFSRAVVAHRVAADRYARFRGPVRFTYGSLTHPRFGLIRDRLADVFPDFRSERVAGLHHLHSEHQERPDQVAAALRELWTRSGQRSGSDR